VEAGSGVYYYVGAKTITLCNHVERFLSVIAKMMLNTFSGFFIFLISFAPRE
jgi:hypothetical protein